MSVQISVSDDVKKVLDQMAKQRDISIGDAAEFMIGVAVSRLNALRKYAKKGEAPKAKAPAKKAAKKASKKSE